MLEEIEREIVQAETNVAPLPAAELASLKETAHLLRSPKNARRLLTALRRAERRQD
jgi:PHD/YefM family antitoxin component YafN of YafNO toxin-antitoxin module